MQLEKNPKNNSNMLFVTEQKIYFQGYGALKKAREQKYTIET